MTTDILTLLADKLSYAVLFVVLFWWTLRSNEKREQRYLNLLDCYGKQLEIISGSLLKILDRLNHYSKEN